MRQAPVRTGEEPQRGQPVQPVVAVTHNIRDSRPLAHLEVAQRDDDRGRSLVTNMTARAKGDGLSVRASPGMTQ